MLRLKADSGVLIVDDTFLACHCAVKEVAGIYLYSRLVGVDVEHDARFRAIELDSEVVDAAVVVKHEVMVIAIAVLDLLVGEILYEFTDGACCAEVKRSALDSGDFACSHIGGVYRSVSVGNNLHEIVGYGVSRIAGEVEVGMVCKVYDSGFYR